MSKGNSITKVSDKVLLGKEPSITEASTRIDVINALNWYNYFHTNDDFKSYLLEYVKKHKYEKEDISRIASQPAWKFSTVGIYARILNIGGSLPEEQRSVFAIKLGDLLAKEEPTESEKKLEAIAGETPEETAVIPTISIQERTRNKAMSLASELEGEIDVFIEGNKNSFDLKNWFIKNDVKPTVGNIIAERFKPRYEEIFDALEGKDEELVYAYRTWKKPILKAYMEFLKELIGLAEERETIAKQMRGPRKRKEKPASVVASKLKYMKESTDYGIKSVNPSEIIKANQVWTFDTKSRNLFVFNAMGPAGLSIKGTKITGFDNKTSFGKKLRKPETVIKSVLEGGKVKLRKLLDEINAKPKETNGRITENFIILKVI